MSARMSVLPYRALLCPFLTTRHRNTISAFATLLQHPSTLERPPADRYNGSGNHHGVQVAPTGSHPAACRTQPQRVTFLRDAR